MTSLYQLGFHPHIPAAPCFFLIIATFYKHQLLLKVIEFCIKMCKTY